MTVNELRERSQLTIILQVKNFQQNDSIQK
jgi:hypothetical protein